MASNFFCQFLKKMNKFKDDDNRPERPDVFSSLSRAVELQQAQREALILQTQRLCASQTTCTEAVLDRLRVSTQQDLLPSPPPPAGVRQKPASSVRGRRTRTVSAVAPFAVTPRDPEETWRHQISPDIQDGEEQLVGRGQSSSRSVSVCYEDSFSSVDTQTPPELRAIPFIRSPVEETLITPSPPPSAHVCYEDSFSSVDTETPPELRAIPFIRSPVEETPFTPSPPPSAHVCYEDSFSSVDTETPPELRAIPFIRSPVEETPFTPSPPPSAPQLSRRVSRLPVMMVNLRAADKGAAGGYGLQTAQRQIQLIQDRLKAFAPLPRPPAVLKRTPALLAPAPPVKPAPPKKAGARRWISTQPVNTGKKTGGICNIRTAEIKKREELYPLSNPVESLCLCLNMLNSDDWTKKMEGLRCVRALAQHHPNTLMVKLHEVCLAVVEEVRNLRSSVACAAMDTIICLYVHLQRDMDTEADRTGHALLLKIAQSSANVFVQQQANVALEALVQNCSPGQVLPALLNMGLSHLSAAVRTSTAQQLHLLADRLGAAAVLTARQSFSQRFLTAVSKMSLDAASEVRSHGRAILQELSLHKDFMKLWQKTVGEKDRRLLEKILRNAVKK